MYRKLGGYFLLSFFSFCFFTGIFHTVANAQVPLVQIVEPKSGIVDDPTPTIYIRQTATPKQVTNTQANIPLPTPTIYTAPRQQVVSASTQTQVSSQTTKPTEAQTKITPTETPTPTVTPVPQPTIAVVTDLEALFSKYSDAYHADKELLKKIARCESGFNTTSNNSGIYLGMFQFATQTWINARAAMGMDTNPDLRINAEEAIRTAAYMIANGRQASWPNCH